MCSPCPDISVYELALNRHLPPPLQLSPSTLKAAIAGLVDLLIEQRLSVNLFVKLPQQLEWQADIERYHSTGINIGLYFFDVVGSQEKNEPDTEMYLGSPHPLKHSHKSDFNHRPVSSSPVLLNVSPESSVAREYFVLAVSQSFWAGIIAHRPRSLQQSSLRQHAKTANNSSQDRHPLLLALCSLSRHTLEPVLQSLQELSPQKLPVLVGSVPQNPVVDLSTINATEQFSVYAAHLWAKQIQQQEELWRGAGHYGTTAAEIAAIQLHNQELKEAIGLKDEFLSNVGQALRTPLTNMKTALTLLKSPNLKIEQRNRYIQMLLTECDRQTSLINGLLDLVRLDHLVDSSPSGAKLHQTGMETLRLSDIVPGVVSTYQPLAQEKGIMLAYTVPEDLPPVSCLSAWVKQIVINLLHNGIKFTPAGGQVWVKAKQQGDYISLEFRDTGIGIPPAELHKIFERFYRVRHAVDDDPGGAGLGLTIVQQLLLRCGGSISVKSKLGQGSTFNVMLPVYLES
ncbi:ATP-binding protein [Ancylothrix sp. C2]|uniref:ATP-binding protein n=1 Tax=Ancylothrix sp. D3o TaxID=2953691 RepID=UPI0021BAE6F1|nr:ATP-binding protein [Ancylothrix sp. D3o]MCT7948641.1 ATP-binding protein [Ancylothrix sp. D3o]